MANKTEYYTQERTNKDGKTTKTLYISNFELATPADRQIIEMYINMGYKPVAKKESSRKKMPSDKLNREYIIQICYEDKLKYVDKDGKTGKIIPAADYFEREFNRPTKIGDVKNPDKKNYLTLKKEFLDLLKKSILDSLQDKVEKRDEYKAYFDKKGKERLDILDIRDIYNNEFYHDEEKLTAADIK